MAAAQEAMAEQEWETVAGPVEVQVTFFLERPSSIPQSKRPWPIKPPDLDKLVRSLDSLTDAGVWEDDSQICILQAAKCYADTREPGAEIRVRIF